VTDPSPDRVSDRAIDRAEIVLRGLAAHDESADGSGTQDWGRPSRLVRVEELLTTNEWVPKLWESEDALLVVVDDDRRLAVTEQGTALRFTRPSGPYDSDRHYLLGYVDGAPRFATRGDLVGDLAGASATVRDIAADLDDLDRDIALSAVAITNWHRNEPYCPRCGTASRVGKAGFMRICPNCGNEYFPRTDPAVIVAIIAPDGRLLLGRQSTWGNRVSVFAGFVESGESAEQAVHREMAEEVGVSLREVRYFGSQPWPFPRSLMLGFVAYAVSSDVYTDSAEISYADWFSRERLDREHAEGTIALPPPSSIANRLVTAWRNHKI
jgi:NAD+ diphosphatase